MFHVYDDAMMALQTNQWLHINEHDVNQIMSLLLMAHYR